MQHPDEGTIHTWLDGELSPDDAAALETHIAVCSECAAAVAEARGFIAGSSRIVSALDIVPGDVIPIAVPAAALTGTPTAVPLALRHKRSWYNTAQFRAAAAVVFVAGASVILLRDGKDEKMATVMDSRAAETAPMEAPAPQPMVAEQDVRSLKSADQAKDEGSAAKGVGSQVAGGSAQKEKRSETKPSSVAQAASGVGSVAAAARESAEGERRNFNDGKMQRVPAAAAQVPAPRPEVTPPARMRADAGKTQLSDVVVTGVALATAPPMAGARPPSAAPLRVVRADTVGSTVRTRFEVSPGVEVILTETRVSDASGASTAQRQVAIPLSNTSSRPAPPGAPSAPVAHAARVDSVNWVSAVSGKSYVFSGPLTKDQLTVLRSRLPADTR